MAKQSIMIPAGTEVLSDKSDLIELLGDVYIDDAVRQADGGYTYRVGNRQYYVSAGNIA